MAIPVSRRLDFSEIPQIDAGPLLSDNPDAALISELAAACTDVGFFYVRNHGVPSEQITEIRHQAERFFEQPMADKMKLRIDQKMRGYLPLDYASYKGEDREAKSRQEGFWAGNDRPASDHYFLDGPNQWSPDHPELRDAMLAYQNSMENLTTALERGFARALGLAADGLAPYFARPMTMLKLNHYPPQDNPENVSYIGVVPHTDAGAFTILWQDDGDGLEIQNRSGEWIGAPSIPGTFVINIGNIMQIWSGGRFSSTPHRVINRGGRDRYSIPLFVYPGHEAMIEPLIGAERNDDEPVMFGNYIRNIWRRTFPIAGIPEGWDNQP